MRYCPNYRDLRKIVKRRTVRHLLLLVWVILVCEFVSASFDAWSFANQKSFQETDEGREVNQYENIVAINRAGLYTEDQKRIIADNWEKLKFKNKPNPFEEYKTKIEE